MKIFGLSGSIFDDIQHRDNKVSAKTGQLQLNLKLALLTVLLDVESWYTKSHSPEPLDSRSLKTLSPLELVSCTAKHAARLRST
jgi:hypothetical protein